LRVRDRAVGVIRIGDPAGLRFDAAQAVFAEGLAGYAALALERARLASEAERVVALKEADRLKDALMASVSHDLRTPLTTIRALASELRYKDERAGVIESEADRLNRLVTDLLDLSRIRAGALPLDLQIVAAEDLVGAALQRLAGLPGADRIVVSLPADDTIPAARMDFVQSLRALGNLLENALQHSPPGQVVELEVRVEGAALALRVLDRGPGVPEAERDRIFEPFYRGASAASMNKRGTGLGLAIAKSVAEAQGGSVARHDRLGGGSVFVLELPSAAVNLD
jgi:two-component system sensor histidine kinase KdpD